MNDKTWKRAANKSLKKKGLRLATFEESGWYYNVVVDGEVTNVWVTDL